MRILVAPAHYIFSPGSFSEFKWAYDLVKAISSLDGISGDVIAGYSDVTAVGDMKVHSLFSEIKPMTLLDKLRFPFQVYQSARRLIAETGHYDVVWHLLPFGIGQTFNLLFILPRSSPSHFALGPIQCPQTYSGSDENMMHWYGANPSRAALLKQRMEVIALALGAGLIRPWSDRTIRKSNLVLAATEDAAIRVRPVASPLPVPIIPYGITTSGFPYSPRAKAKGEGITVSTVGALVHRKRVDLILDMVAELVTEGYNLRLNIIGDGPQRPLLEELTHRLGITDHVSFLGRVPHSVVPQLLVSTDVLISASISESFGNTLLEGMCMGKAVVAAENAGSRSLILHEQTGLLVPPGDARALAGALRGLLQSEEKRESLGAMGARMVRERYEWTKLAGELVKLFGSL